MLSSSHKPKRLPIDAIESSPEIQRWMSQFPRESIPLAASLLRNLIFISRDDYSQWFHESISSLPHDRKYAIYGVRKLEDSSNFWDSNGDIVSRPGTSQGSEDLVYSLIANVVRSHKGILFDNPSLTLLREERIHDLILFDDSIGSGNRVYDYIRSMQNNPTFLSWWSFGLLRIHVYSFSRMRQAENTIMDAVKGSDRGRRKYRKSSKFQFQSRHVYVSDSMVSRWGTQAQAIVNLCESTTQIPRYLRLGYKSVASNVVFYHSVPNNLPGVIWYGGPRWRPLFPERCLPNWLIALLEEHPNPRVEGKPLPYYDPDIISILTLVKGGNRRPETIALKMDCEIASARRLLAFAQELGLLSKGKRLTMTGLDALIRANRYKPLPNYDRTLYIPSTWCTDQPTTQPPKR